MKFRCCRLPRPTHSRSRKGAWIEISVRAEFGNDPRVAPVRERGLKLKAPALLRFSFLVAPVRERGLKCFGGAVGADVLRRSRKGAWIEMSAVMA